jgi:hypothetical protein
MLSEAGKGIYGNSKPIANSFPEEWMMKSDKQVRLEKNGCAFRGQERLDAHEEDTAKDCYCGRPNRVAI